MFLFETFLMEIFFWRKIFWKKLFIKYFFLKHYKYIFLYYNLFIKFFEKHFLNFIIHEVFSKTLFNLKAFFKIIINELLYLIWILLLKKNYSLKWKYLTWESRKHRNNFQLFFKLNKKNSF